MADYSYKDILRSIYNAIQGVSDNIYLTNRPNSVPEKIMDFMVISMPVSVTKKTVGTGYGLYTTYCRITIYVRETAMGQDINKIDSMITNVIDAFPISNDIMMASNPRTIMNSNDSFGFHIATIQANLLIK